MLGGIMIGLLTLLGDMVDAIGSSTGILLSTSIIYRYCEKIGKD
jgi:preprotein translocase subunit SecY